MRIKAKHIRVYDFDDTGFYTPKPDVDDDGNNLIRLIPSEIPGGKAVECLVSEEFEKATGSPWSYRGWWGKRESLDTSIFEIKRNEYIYDEYLKDINGIDKYIISMTGRLSKLRKEVRAILDSNGYVFDAYYFNPGGMNTYDYKIGVINKYISENPQLETIKMYDDRTEHIQDFIDWAEGVLLETGVEIEIIHVQGEGRIN